MGISCVVAAGILWGGVGMFGKILQGAGLTSMEIVAVRAVLALVALGVCCTAAPFLLYTLGLNRMDASKAAIIVAVEPVTSCLIGIIGFGEALTVFSGLGIACVIASIALLSRGNHEGQNT